MEFFDARSPLKDTWTKDKRREYWDARAPQYGQDLKKSDIKTQIARQIGKALMQGTQRRVLDVGTGTGTLLFEIRERMVADRYVGIDFSSKMIEIARETARRNAFGDLVFEVAEATHLPFDDGSFDAVVSSMALHHLTDVEKMISLREIRRILTPGGTFINGDLLFAFSTDTTPLEVIRKRVQQTFFPNESPAEVRARFRDEPVEWPVSIWEYQTLMCQEGLIVRKALTLNPVVSIIFAESPP